MPRRPQDAQPARSHEAPTVVAGLPVRASLREEFGRRSGAATLPRVPTCVSCGRENPDESRFCNGCGAALEVPRAASAEERKVVTVLFADITGSTALGERLDAEQLKEVMGAFFAAMRVEIEAEGGTVEKFIGDAVMAAFGVPQRARGRSGARAAGGPADAPPPRRAERGARRAPRRRARAAHRHQHRPRSWPSRLRGRARRSPRAMRSTRPRVSSRPRQPGQVLVAERTAQAARHFRFGSPQVLEMRGRAEPLRARRAARRPADHRGHAVRLAGAARRPPPRARAAHHDLPRASSRRGGRTS